MKFFSKALLATILAIILSTSVSAQAEKRPIHDAGPGMPVVLLKKQPVVKKPIKQPEIKPVVALAPIPAPTPPPPPPPALSDSLSVWLLKLRTCESGGNYAINTGNGFYGAYQFTISTWNSLNTGYSRADLAPPAVQDQAIIANTNRSSGGLATQNPGCYSKEGLSAFPPG